MAQLHFYNGYVKGIMRGRGGGRGGGRGYRGGRGGRGGRYFQQQEAHVHEEEPVEN